MDRAAADPRRQAAFAGLLTALAVACATVQQPPGGPPDPNPPVLLGVTPDSGVAVVGFDDEVIFEFDEVLTESGLDNLFTVSPRHREIRVSWKRKRVGIKPRDGWKPNVPYRITLAPGVTDLRNNRTDSGYEATFTTGGALPTTVITGNTVDWEGGRIAGQALIEAIRTEDSLTFLGSSDSVGTFTLEAVPPGRYLLSAAIDQNRNTLRDSRESFDTVTVSLDSTLSHDFWMFAHDTVGPRIQQVSPIDSLAIGVDFNQSLALDLPGVETARVRLLPDSVPVAVAGIMWRAPFDSLRARERDSLAAVADSLRADSLAAAAAAADTVVADTAAVADTAVVAGPPPQRLPPVPPPPAQPAEPPAAEEEPDPEQVRQQELLAQRPALLRTIVILMAQPLLPGERYVVETRMRNLLGAEETSLRLLIVPVPDSTAND